MQKLIKGLLSLAATMLFVVSAHAQFTTSTMTGKVTDENGEALVGAAVVAVHTPSGSQYYAVVNDGGYYTIQGMRPGGPYEVTVSLIGCQTVKYTDIVLSLGETSQTNATLKTDAELLDEVVVIASSSKFTTEKTGASVNVSNREINNLPSVNRSIEDLTKLSPYANGLSFAGTDGRSTNFTVDGANFNNNFGLFAELPGGGSPISIDAIEEVQLVVAPYDVRQSNFVGGGINAITKSGTNTFKGTAYAYYNNQNLRGNKIAGEDLGERPLEVDKTLGFTLGGPIIKNKLFFFVNFETDKLEEQTIKYHAAKPGEVGGQGLVSRTTAADMQRVYDRLKNDYGYDPGSFTDFPGGEESTKFLARIDWNISDAHKLSVRFNKTYNTVWNEPTSNSSDDGFRNKKFSRVSEESMAFANNMWGQMSNVTSVAAELNSKFSDKVSNQLLFTYTYIDETRKSNSAVFPHIDIMQGLVNGKATAEMKPAVSAGYELFAFNNVVKTTNYSLADNATFSLGAHKVTAGINWDFQNAKNSYMRNGSGYYRFASVDDFVNGGLPVGFAYTIGANGVERPVNQVSFNKFAAYVQDEWNVNEKFKLIYGLRGDLIAYDNSQIVTNKSILAVDLGGRHVDTGHWPKTTLQLSPRVGFNWDVNGDKSLVVRGGAGVFQGRLPLVFFTNMPSNSGIAQISTSKVQDPAVIEKLRKADGTMVTDVKEMARILGLNTTVTPDSAPYTGDIVGVDPDFKMPQTAKVSLAFDYKVPVNFPLSITAEGMYTKTLHGVMLSNWALNEGKVSATKFAGVDDRYDYSAVSGSFLYDNVKSAYVLTNTNKGYGWNAAFTVNAQPFNNFDLTASYVHTVSKEVSGMPGSNAESAFQKIFTVNGVNFADAQNSIFVVPDKVMVNASYFVPFKVFGGNGLHLNLYYSAYSPNAYNYIINGDMNGDGNAADLMYIYGKGSEVNFVDYVKDGKVVFTAADQAKAYDAFLAQDKYLRSHKGQYAEAASGHNPWVHRFDFRVAEDFSFRVGKTTHNFQLSASIENIGNLLNSNWGLMKWSCYQTSDARESNIVTPLSYMGKDASGKPTYNMNPVNGALPTETYSKFYYDPSQCFKVLFGIKYLFN